MRNFKAVVLYPLLLVFVVFLLLEGFTAPYFFTVGSDYHDAPVRRSLKGELDTLILGSSQALRALQPTLLDAEMDISSYNLSSPLLSMCGRYMLLKKELDRNPIETVYIELSYDAMSRDRREGELEGDIYLLGRFDFGVERLLYTCSVFSPKQVGKLFSDTLQQSVKAWASLEEKASKTPKQYETKGYLSVWTNDMTVPAEEMLAAMDTKHLDETFVEDNVKWLDRILALCKEKDLRTVIIVTPVSEKMLIEYDNFDAVFDRYREIAKESGCAYYDFNLDKERMELYPEETAFYDKSHLSGSGAETFSLRFASLLCGVADGEDISSHFFGSYREAREHILKTKYDACPAE